MKEKGEEKERRIEERSGKEGRNWRDKRRDRAMNRLITTTYGVITVSLAAKFSRGSYTPEK